jgi:hypothetical protein
MFRSAVIGRLHNARQKRSTFTAFVVQLKLPTAGENCEALRGVYEIAREFNSSSQIIESERAGEDKEAFRGSSRRQLG